VAVAFGDAPRMARQGAGDSAPGLSGCTLAIAEIAQPRAISLVQLRLHRESDIGPASQ
jgi:hypothetical protein